MEFFGRLCRPLISCCTNDQVSPFMDAEEVLKKVRPTDLIEFRRKDCVHWGMYIGLNRIIHLQNNNGVGTVQEDMLIKVALDGKEIGDKCRINNKEDKLDEWSKLPGFINEIRDPDLVIEEARKYKYQTLTYDLISNNCEHLCMKWKYGVSKSEQVESAAKLIAGGGAATTGTGTAVAVAVAEAGEEAAEDAAKEKVDEEREVAEAAAMEKAENAKENATGFLKRCSKLS